MAFPRQRLRRLRQSEPLRRMVRETALAASDLIYPMFVTTGRDRREEIGSMPGQYRWSVDLLIKEVMDVKSLGIPAVILFGIPDRKDDRGTSAFDPNGIVQQAIRSIKDQVPDILVITDVCIDEYTSHGHCGIVKDGRIVNDETLECLREMARDACGRRSRHGGAIRYDGWTCRRHSGGIGSAGFPELPIMAYAAKFASCFYAPFRDAAFES